MINHSHTALSDGILSTIGATPLVRLKRLFRDSDVRIYAKWEGTNPGGSIKDRTAVNILKHELHKGSITSDTTVVESSSGNMAIGLAQACLYYGLKFIAVVDPLINLQTMKILRAYGAEIVRVTQPDEQGSFLQTRVDQVKMLLKQIDNSYWPNQYSNPLNPEAHFNTMKEIIEGLGRQPDYLLAATSTCGTLMGCAAYKQEAGLDTRLVAVDAKGSAIFENAESKRLIPGHGAGRPSELLDSSVVHQVIHITDYECISGCRQLLATEAILAGGSSGANIFALKKLLPQIPQNATCVIILCDRGDRYLDTIYSKAWVRKHFGLQQVANV